jgi:hypothetical protein
MVDPHTLSARVRHQEGRSHRVENRDPNLPCLCGVGILNDFGKRISVQPFGTALASFKDSLHDTGRLAL